MPAWRVIIRMSAIRKLAAEAGDNGLLAADLAAGILRVKSVKSVGIRVGNWPSGAGAVERPRHHDGQQASRSCHPWRAPGLRTAAIGRGGAHVRACPEARPRPHSPSCPRWNWFQNYAHFVPTPGSERLRSFASAPSGTSRTCLITRNNEQRRVLTVPTAKSMKARWFVATIQKVGRSSRSYNLGTCHRSGSLEGAGSPFLHSTGHSGTW